MKNSPAIDIVLGINMYNEFSDIMNSIMKRFVTCFVNKLWKMFYRCALHDM